MEYGLKYVERRSVKYDLKDYKKATMPDEYINYQATKGAIDKYEKSPFKNIDTAAVYGFALANSVAVGALTEGNKTKAMLNQGKLWGLFFIATEGIHRLADAVINRVPPFRKFKEKHPGLTNIGVIVGSVYAGLNTAIIANKHIPEPNLDSKFLNDKVFKPVGDFLSSNAGRKVLNYGAPALIGGIIAKNVLDVKRVRKNKQKIAQQLEQERAATQQKILDSIKVERKFYTSEAI